MNPLVFKLGGYQGPTSINTRGAMRFGEALSRALGERVKFELVGDVLALGRKSGELPDMVDRGELTACYMSTVRFAPAVPELKVLELPFVVPDRAAAISALDGYLGERFTRGMHERTAFRVLGFWDNGFRHFTNRIRPIHTPADCKGIRIRTQVSELHAEALAALGFEPIPVDIKEFVEQARTDRFQAQENPLTNTFHFGLQHLHRYITLSSHFFGASAFVCNTKLFNSWSDAVKQAVLDAAQEATQHQRALAAQEDDDVLARIDPRENEVVTLTSAERKQFIEAVAPVVARHRASLEPALFESLQD